MRRFSDDILIIATHNQGKFREFQELLEPYVKEIVSAEQAGLPDTEETGETFADNAILKAKAAARKAGRAALADDSGLCVTALDGKPGLHSARWAGPDRDFKLAMKSVHEAMGAAHDRSACFICVLALAWPDGHTELVEGRCDGMIVWPPRGEQGHGYDPFFAPLGHERTFAEMSAIEKQALSHRGVALRELVARHFKP